MSAGTGLSAAVAEIAIRREREYRERYGLKRLKSLKKQFKTQGRKFMDYTTFWDHPSLYREIATGAIVEVYQPYFNPEYVPILKVMKASVDLYAEQNGLIGRMSILESWHFPGKTILIEYRKKEASNGS